MLRGQLLALMQHQQTFALHSHFIQRLPTLTLTLLAHLQERFQSAGGVVGALLATTGAHLPGCDAAVADGSSLGRSLLLFHLPQASRHRLAY